ncbi:SPX domain-containing membrane protein OsI_21475-like isoform X2 [Zingiber officinale]|uniref:SPX domain-containing membrane protein OsI_21475-like isoform X2 n=1 Tax=Zingiber officinale TaxID=94328 RepID=UPI001C4DB7C1|nr:SPX domain-containing membrane protein OsI_21475-like isoform X2 [Zingiber officinale]
MVVQDPVICLIQALVEKLTRSTNFLKFLGQHALIQEAEEHVDERRYHFVSLLLNLVNTLLYMVNTYIIVPTADDYSMSLGAAATVCGIIIGSMAVAQVFSSVYFSAWSNKLYFRPLVFSSIVLFLGNVLYALAYDLNSLTILLIGRLMCGTNKELVLYTSTITLFFRTTMNGKKGNIIQIDICLPSNSTPQSESMKKSTKDHNGKATIPMRKLMREVWEFAREDTDRATFSLKVGLACLLVSLLILIQAPDQVFATNFILEKVGMKKKTSEKEESNEILQVEDCDGTWVDNN